MPPPKPGHKAQRTCSARCRKIASRLHLQAAAQHLEEAARQQRLAHWQVFQPTIRSCLERVTAVGRGALVELCSWLDQQQEARE